MSPANSVRDNVAPHQSSAPLPSSALPEAEEGSLHETVLRSLDDDQAQEIVSIDLEGKSGIADFMVVASGRSTRQVAAIATKLSERIKQAGHPPPKMEGLAQGDWVLIDAGDVVVHVFRPEVRTFYNLERMWTLGEA